MDKKSLLSQFWLQDQLHDHHVGVHLGEVHHPGGDDHHHHDIGTEGKIFSLKLPETKVAEFSNGIDHDEVAPNELLGS